MEVFVVIREEQYEGIVEILGVYSNEMLAASAVVSRLEGYNQATGIWFRWVVEEFDILKFELDRVPSEWEPYMDKSTLKENPPLEMPDFHNGSEDV